VEFRHALSKLIVAIPAYNEELALPQVLKSVKKNLASMKRAFILVVDDGSRDRTAEVAIESGADIVVSHERNMGIAQAYKTAIKTALSFGAHVICTIDADGQFMPSQISNLVVPIIRGEADLVIGSRFIDSDLSKNIPITNKIGNRLIALLVSLLIGRHISDTESGFRALSRRAAEELNLLGIVSFSNDMIIDLSWKKQRIIEVPVKVKYYDTRVSRVIKNFAKYGFKSICLIAMKLLSRRLPCEAQIEYRPKTRILLAPKSNWASESTGTNENMDSELVEIQKQEGCEVAE